LRFGLLVEQTRRNAPFIVASTCQSEIKRTLRLAGATAKERTIAPFRSASDRSFDANGEREVSEW
jgi:hypothetical protein